MLLFLLLVLTHLSAFGLGSLVYRNNARQANIIAADLRAKLANLKAILEAARANRSVPK